MKRHRLRFAAIPAVLWVLAVLAASTFAVSTFAAPRQQPSGGAVSTLADCSAKTGRVAVTFLIDESASLRDTDPDNRRVDAVKAALTSLAQVADRTASTAVPVRVDVSMLGFGVGTTEIVPWTTIDSSRLPDLLSASEQFATRNSEIDTDYAAALSGASNELAHLPSPDVTACTAILWFTDGHYDIQARSTGETKPYAPNIALHNQADADALRAAGIQFLCQDGGLVDSLRGGGTQIFAVALSSPSAPIAPEDQDFLQAVAEGTAGSQRCGAARAPGAAPVGEYLGAGDVSQLISGFFDVVGNLAGGTALESASGLTVCARQACEAGTHQFTVDPGFVALSALAVSSVPAQVELRSAEPSSTPLVVSPVDPGGQSALGAATVRWTRVAPGALLLDVTLPGEQGAWNGAWSVGFVDPSGQLTGTGSLELFAFGDVEPFINPVQFRAGDTNTFTVVLRHRDGSGVDVTRYQSIELEAAIVDPATGKRTPVELGPPDATGTRTGTWEAPSTDFPAKIDITVTARATTTSGVALTAVTRSLSTDVLPPSAYPTVQPTALRFDTITGTKTQQAVLTVTGGDTAAGCVWFDGSQLLHGPSDAGNIRVEVDPPAVDQATCLRVDSLERRELRVRITPSHTAAGRVDGTLRFVLISDANPAQLRLAVAFEAPLEKVLDTGKAIAIWLVLMAIGLAIPVVFMWLLSALTATFEPPSSLMVARIPITITASDHVYRTGGAIDDGLTIAGSEFEPLEGEGRTRAFDVPSGSHAGSGAPDVLHFRSRPPRNPFARAIGEVAVDEGAVASVPGPNVGKDGSAAPVPFGLAGAAVVLVSGEALDTAPVALGATIAMALGQDAGSLYPDEPAAEAGAEPGGSGSSSFGRRPDLEATLLAFAPAGELPRYTAHFDRYRGAIAAAVDRLYELHRSRR